MKLRWVVALTLSVGIAAAQESFESKFRASIERFLGRPYVWGATGEKSFDCSGFVWRVAAANGLFIKRTTARKLYFSTEPVKAGEKGRFGNLIFFDDLRHIGIVNDRRSFYHAQVSKGTNLSQMTPYWATLAGGEHRFFTPAPSSQRR
jgi:cell wall-associated NlpC family hydrolase